MCYAKISVFKSQALTSDTSSTVAVLVSRDLLTNSGMDSWLEHENLAFLAENCFSLRAKSGFQELLNTTLPLGTRRVLSQQLSPSPLKLILLPYQQLNPKKNRGVKSFELNKMCSIEVIQMLIFFGHRLCDILSFTDRAALKGTKFQKTQDNKTELGSISPSKFVKAVNYFAPS